MKETVYANYPPARDPWKTYRVKDPYHTECLYKFIGSKYTGGSGVGTPQAPSPLQLSGTGFDFPQSTQPYGSAQRAEIQNHKRRPKSVRPLGKCWAAPTPHPPPSAHQSLSKSLQQLEQQQRVQRPASSKKSDSKALDGLQIQGRCASAKKSIARTASTAESCKPATPLSGRWVSPKADIAISATPQESQPNAYSARVKSAYQPRPRPTPPSRPAKSAEPRNRLTTTKPASPTNNAQEMTSDLDEEDIELNVGDDEDEESVVDVQEDDTESVCPSPIGVDNPMSYDEQLKKYGWKMEIPGDPLNLKRHCLPKRGAFTVTVPSATIAPDPPKVHIETAEPFFSNTIPRQPLTFSIHQDWSSEVLLAKRLELQKRDGDQYKYRQNYFSFLY